MKLIKSQYSLTETIDLLSIKYRNGKRIIKTLLKAEYQYQLMETCKDIENKLGHLGYHGLTLEDALSWFRISKEEVERWEEYFESFPGIAKLITDSKPKKKGRPNSHGEVEKEIEKVLGLFKGMRYSQAKRIDLVSKKVDRSPGTLKRHYKKCFPAKGK